MNAWLNDLSGDWYNYMVAASVQNSIYIGIILLLLYLFKEKDVRFLRVLTLIGLVKLCIPPLIKSPEAMPINIIDLSVLQINAVAANLPTFTDTGLFIQSWLMLLWIAVSLLILIVVLKNTIELRQNFKHIKLLNISRYLIQPLPNYVKIYQSDQNHSPLLLGFFQKKIILPRDWDSWNADCKSAVIAHELTHIQQRDPWINLLRILLLSINFFNPFVWILSRKLTQYSEMVCDDFTINKLRFSGLSYSRQLVSISEQAIKNKPAMVTSLAFSESYRSIKNRITYQLSKTEEIIMKKFSTWQIFIASIICISMVFFSWQCKTDEIIDDMEVRSDITYDYIDVAQKPVLSKKVAPEYPVEARKAGLSGKVVVTVIIDENGDVLEAELSKAFNDSVKIMLDDQGNKEVQLSKKSKSRTSLDEAALIAAKQCKFEPGIIEGKPVKVKLNIPFDFKLK